MSNKDIYCKALDLIAMNPSLISEIQVNPNIDFPTAGGEVWWDTLAYSSNGWKLQINKLTSLGRVLDSSNIRKAWGAGSILKRKLRDLYEAYGENDSASNSNSNNNSYGGSTYNTSDATKKLLDLKTLLDAGAITQTEYDRMKSEIMNQFFTN